MILPKGITYKSTFSDEYYQLCSYSVFTGFTALCLAKLVQRLNAYYDILSETKISCKNKTIQFLTSQLKPFKMEYSVPLWFYFYRFYCIRLFCLFNTAKHSNMESQVTRERFCFRQVSTLAGTFVRHFFNRNYEYFPFRKGTFLYYLLYFYVQI